MNQPQPLRFVTESTLGKLCKWLRLAGFDTLHERGVPDVRTLTGCGIRQNRVILTRTCRVYSRLASRGAVFIPCNDPHEQIRLVIDATGLRREDMLPLTRCLACNLQLAVCPPDTVHSQVPEYIRHVHRTFRICPGCKRVYWPGSHSRRCLEMVDGWFETTPMSW
jgi:uncharacterized protein